MTKKGKIFCIPKRMIFSLILSFTFVLFSSCESGRDNKSTIQVPTDSSSNTNPDEPVKPEENLSMVDPEATLETKALYSHLWSIAKEGFMFGHHDDLWYGRYWYNVAGESDTKDVCGDYPAVFSFDLGPYMDSRHKRKSDIIENEIRLRVAHEAKNRGEVLLVCCHLNNPLTEKESNLDSYPEGTSWDNSKCVDQIIEEGNSVHDKFFTWLDRFADFAKNFKGDDGKLIPIIFRPFHEHTQSWSWWGSNATSEQEFVTLWRMTVKYLRDKKDVHNLIYAISPQMDADYGSNAKGRYLSRWPGDEYVDFLGIDCYHGGNFAAFKANLSILAQISSEKNKPCGVTETGWESFTASDYWTKGILEPVKGKAISMVVMWRNKYVGDNESDKHFFSVYPKHPSAADFISMYNDEASIFSKDLPDMYKIEDGITVK